MVGYYNAHKEVQMWEIHFKINLLYDAPRMDKYRIYHH